MARTRTAPGRTRIIATVDRGIVARLDEMAEREKRSRSQMVEIVLDRFIDEVEEERQFLEERRRVLVRMGELYREGKAKPGEDGLPSPEFCELMEEFFSYFASRGDDGQPEELTSDMLVDAMREAKRRGAGRKKG